MNKIVLTGGGTAGHVTPNIALLPKLKEAGYSVSYIGSYEGIEKKLIEDCQIPYHGKSSGKLRRYFSWKNFSDPFRVIAGFGQARKLLRKINPDIMFSKGGFVSVPVVLAAKRLHIPVIIHESDITPGLANKIAMRSASKICCNFPETLSYLPKDKAVLTGSPIRQELFLGKKENGLKLCQFHADLPVLMIIGGSIGSVIINNSIREILTELTKDFQIIHICGKGNVSEEHQNISGYKQFEYVSAELPDLFAASNLVISRAGANVICELLALNKPNLLIPLSATTSRGDQILNANSFEKQGFSMVLPQENLTSETLLNSIQTLHSKEEQYKQNLSQSNQGDAVEKVFALIESCKRINK